MKIVIPMAGLGKRLRPFTLTTAKPLLKIAGKSVLRRLTEKIIRSVGAEVTDVAFIVGDFPEKVLQELRDLGDAMNFKAHIFRQHEALGTAHAIYEARDIMDGGELVVAFADTLFEERSVMRRDGDVVIWTSKVSSPELYGVVLKDENEHIRAFHEKPQEFVSDEGVIGIYFFRDSLVLRSYLEDLIKNDRRVNGEFQLTDVLQDMLDAGKVFVSQEVETWLDCGNPSLLLSTSSHVLMKNDFDEESHEVENSIILEPVYLGRGVCIKNSVIGPNVSVEADTVIEDSRIENSIIYEHSQINSVNIKNSVIGNYASVDSVSDVLLLGDYGKISL